MRTLWTFGHGTRTEDEVARLLRGTGVRVVADVRRFPGSRRHPQFAREAMERWLPDAWLRYGWHGETLGGRRSVRDRSRHPAWRNSAFRGYADHMDEAEFRDSFLELERRTESEAIAVMCAETLWWRCHRRLIADAFVARGGRVVHLIGEGSEQEHPPNESVRVEDGWPVYDVGVTSELDID